MGTENLTKEQANEKIKSLVSSIDFAMMETNLGGRPTHIIPMSTKKVDDHGRIWFLSNATSEHNRNIENDNKMQLIYSSPGDMKFMSLYGEAIITKDAVVIEKLYGKLDDTWFEGKNDPNVSAIAFTPLDGHYWDTKYNKLVSLIKMGAGVITGKMQDLGTQGDLDV